MKKNKRPNRADDVRVAYPLFHAGCGGSSPTSALHLTFGTIDRKTFKALNEEWHSRLPLARNCFEGVCYGAMFGYVYWAVAWWSKPVAQNRLKDGAVTYELRRLAIHDDAPKNTASRMIAWMIRDIRKTRPEIKKLISYQDTAVHDGTIYKAVGWKPVFCGKAKSWKNRADFNRIDQSMAPKVRWEKEL